MVDEERHLVNEQHLAHEVAAELSDREHPERTVRERGGQGRLFRVPACVVGQARRVTHEDEGGRNRPHGDDDTEYPKRPSPSDRVDHHLTERNHGEDPHADSGRCDTERRPKMSGKPTPDQNDGRDQGRRGDAERRQDTEGEIEVQRARDRAIDDQGEGQDRPARHENAARPHPVSEPAERRTRQPVDQREDGKCAGHE